MIRETSARIQELFRKIPGTIDVVPLDDGERRKVVELESQYESSSTLPIRNLGVRLLGRRSACFALLKDTRFRPPKGPTVFLVEEGVPTGVDGEGAAAPGTSVLGAPADPSRIVVVDGVVYRIVGEEVIAGRDHSSEATMLLDDSFVIFPDRRSKAGVPCVFMLPPISFPELEAAAQSLGIRDILSISPSLATDMWLRSTFHFSPTNTLATLLVGCNSEPGERG
jgi:hypothetical protein